MKKNVFSIGEISKYHIIPFLVPLFHLATSYVQRDIIIENKKYHKDMDFFNDGYEFPYFINAYISKIFSVILYIISKYILNKEEISPELQLTKKIRIYHLNVNSNNKLKILFHIIIISILEVIFMKENIRTLESKGLIGIKLGFTIFVPIFSYILLRIKYYRHHFVSIGIGLFGFIFIILSLFYPSNDEERHGFKEHLKHLSYSIPYSLSLVLIAHLFKHYFIYPSTFLMLNGIFCVFFSFLYILIKTLLILNKTDLFINNLKKLTFIFLNIKIFALFISILILSFLYYLTITLTLYYFTPTLLVMTDILSPVLRWVVDCLVAMFYHEENLNVKQSILNAIGYIFIITASFLFNEIVICNFWKLNYNTIEEIKKRGIEDAIKRDSCLYPINESIISN